jgi:tetratricopeptide (TPR) repeat protein
VIDVAPTPRALELFFSYAHEDERYRERLERHLSTLRNEGLVVDWHDGRIEPGADWDDEIRTRLARADIVLFLVSADFLASDYIARVEIGEALARAKQGSAHVIPVLVNPCDWGSTELAGLQALPSGAKAITSWRNAEEAYLDVTRGIRSAAESLLKQRDTFERGRARAVLKRVAVAMVELTTVGGGDVEREAQALAEASEAMVALLAGHGATVDAVHPDELTAVFGLPRLHEDDTLRAVRSVVQVGSKLAEINEDIGQRLGVTVTARAAVDAGMLLVDDSGAVAAAARTAAAGARRLLRAAPDGEVLIGDDAHRLVSHAVRVEEVPSGRRLVEVLPDAPVRPLRPRSPLVGRDWEVALLRKTFDRSASDRTCRLLVVTGPPGIGKSRLVQEFTRGIASRAVVLKGTCTESHATYWPLFEILKQAASVEPNESLESALAKIARLLDDEQTAYADAQAIAGLVDLAAPTGDAEAAERAVRRLFEVVAAKTPLVVVLDDLHLAKRAFLDLLLSVVEHTYGAPLVLLCLAWPDVDERYPQWGEDLANTTRIRLEPLVAGDAEALTDNLLGGPVEDGLRQQIVDATAGNPLFVEELVAMLVDHGHVAPANGIWRATGELPTDLFPDTVDAVMAERLDALPDAERLVLAAASIEGMRFHHDAVAELTALDSETLEAALAGLSRNELVTRDRPELTGEASSFRHVLICETAYEGIPKGARSELHETFAGWVESVAGDRAAEYDEMLGFHLERAHALRHEADGPSDSVTELGRRAAGFLFSAGRRALARGDMADACGLLERASALLPDGDVGQPRLVFDLGVAQMETGRLEEAHATYERAAALAEARGDLSTEWYARLQRSGLEADVHPELGTEALTAEAAEAFRVFTDLEDDLGLAKVWHRRGFVAAVACRWGETQEDFERARSHAGRAGADRDEAVASSMLFYCFVLGPEPVGDAIARSETILAETRFRGVRGVGLAALGNLYSMRGALADARAQLDESRAVLEDLGQTRRLIEASFFAASAELLGGAAESALGHLERARAAASSAGQKGLLSSIDAHLAETLLALGRDDEAADFAVAAGAAAAEDDVFVQMRWRPVHAKVLARRGELDRALVLAGEAVELAAATDALNAHAAALADQAEVLSAAGRLDDARAALTTATDLYRLKGNVAAEDGLKRQERT